LKQDQKALREAKRDGASKETLQKDAKRDQARQKGNRVRQKKVEIGPQRTPFGPQGF
jgi:hypothetical protein